MTPSPPRRLRALLVALSILLLPALGRPAAAQSGQPKVQVSAKPSKPTAAPGDQLAVAVVLDHADGWHTHTNAPIIPPELGDFEATPAEIIISATTGARAGSIQWPPVHEVPVKFSGKPVFYGVFEGRAIAYIPLVIDPGATGEVSLTISVGYQACDDRICVMPVYSDDPDSQIKLTIPIVQSGAPIPPPDPDFAAFDPAVFATMHEPVTPPLSTPAQPVAPADTASTSSGRTFLGFIRVPSPDSAAGLVVVALLAAVGGLVLNLTPCVLPVIPIKIMTISHHAGTPGKALYLGLMMAAGVVSFWVALGAVAVLVFGVTDPSVIFGIWYVTFTIGIVIGAMALGLMGLFTFNLPQSVYMLNPKVDNAWGSFLFGVMTAVLGLPCFGFVAGALLAGSATLPAIVILTIFASLGVGMASPYLVLSARPGLVDKIPRTGPASELVKQVMGLLLLAAAFFFAIIGLRTLIVEQPHISKVIEWWAVGISAAMAGLWLAYRTAKIGRHPVLKPVFVLVGLIIAALGLTIAIAFDRDERARWTLSTGTAENSAANAAEDGRPWARYTPARLSAAQQQGRIVVVDFTADWCLNCKALEATVLSAAAVQSAIASPDVVSLKADLTSRKDPGWAYLKELGQVGIPLLVVLEPGSEAPTFASNAYTPDMVVQAIENARSRRLSSSSNSPPAR